MDFSAMATDWLSNAEQILRELRAPEASEIVSLKANILATTIRGSDAPAAGRRRAEAASVLQALRRAEELLRTRALNNEGHVDSFEEKLIEAVGALAIVGDLPDRGGQSSSAWAKAVWQVLASHPTTRPTSLWLAASLSGVDRLVLLDRILLRLSDSELPVPLSGARE